MDLITVTPPRLPGALATPLAYGAQVALCIWHRLRGYTSPGTRPEHEPEAALRYDFDVAALWEKTLRSFSGIERPFTGKHILELGPGPDLGIGAIVRALGAESYTAVDANPLALRAPLPFYDSLLERLNGLDPAVPLETIRSELITALLGKSGRISYQVNSDFDLSRLERNRFNLVVSQAAVEHFDDPLRTIAQLSEILPACAEILFQIDFKTHTPVLRDLDPLSIYRISPLIYRMTRYPGVPNRVRSASYIAALKKGGFSSVEFVPQAILAPAAVAHALPGITEQFQSDPQELGVLSALLYGRRP